MGVPKFYRWISERYPCLSQVVKDYQVRGVVDVCVLWFLCRGCTYRLSMWRFKKSVVGT